LGPVVKYILKQFNEGSDTFDSTEFFRDARVFDPVYAASITVQEAHGLLEKLRKNPTLDNDATSKALKASFPQFKRIASAMNLTYVEDILQWHFDLQKSFLVEQQQDRSRDGCRHYRKDECKCYTDLQVWWDACTLIVLVQHWLARSERALSLLKKCRVSSRCPLWET
jgi:hypothetical protein